MTYEATPNNESNDTTMGYIRSSTEDIFAQNEIDKINNDPNDLNAPYYARNDDDEVKFKADYVPNSDIAFEKTTSHDLGS